jgi:hypothetical protein
VASFLLCQINPEAQSNTSMTFMEQKRNQFIIVA